MNTTNNWEHQPWGKKAQLKRLEQSLKIATASTTDKMTKYHFQDCADRIHIALNNK